MYFQMILISVIKAPFHHFTEYKNAGYYISPGIAYLRLFHSFLLKYGLTHDAVKRKLLLSLKNKMKSSFRLSDTWDRNKSRNTQAELAQGGIYYNQRKISIRKAAFVAHEFNYTQFGDVIFMYLFKWRLRSGNPEDSFAESGFVARGSGKGKCRESGGEVIRRMLTRETQRDVCFRCNRTWASL